MTETMYPDASTVFDPNVEAAVALADGEARNVKAEEGQLLYEQDIGGMPMRRFKNRSMVHAGGKPLPERVAVYNALNPNDISYVPTAMLPRILSKTHPDGSRVFLPSRPKDFVPIQYIDQTCDFCLKASNGQVRKRFEDWDTYERHQQDRHPAEWEARERRREREERTEERRLLRQLFERSFEQAAEAKPDPAFSCETCGKAFSKKVALVGHQRSHK